MMNSDPLEQIEVVTKQTNDYMGRKTKGTLSRYPLLFTLLTVFGVVAVIHGFEEAIAQVPFLADRPLLVFLIGVVVLVFTGSLYKGLSHVSK